MPSSPQHTPIIQPTTSNPQKKQKPKKQRRQDPEETQPSGPTTIIANEALNEENRKIANIDVDKGHTLIDETTEDWGRINDEEMCDTDVLNDEEMFAKSVDIKQAKEIVADKDLINDITLAKALMEIKIVVRAAGTRPKAKSIVMQEPSETLITTTIPISSKVQDKGKCIMVEKPLKMKKKNQISFDEQEARRLQAKIDEQDRLGEENSQLTEDENLAWDNVQAMIDADYELAARLQEEQQGELTVEEKPRLFVELMDKRKSILQNLEQKGREENL
nr:hypothetical protein [Tanacetum cinerariifolium]